MKPEINERCVYILESIQEKEKRKRKRKSVWANNRLAIYMYLRYVYRGTYQYRPKAIKIEEKEVK